MDDNRVIDLAGASGRSILDIGFGWIRRIRIPRIKPRRWDSRERGCYARVCVALERERTRRQNCVPDVL